MRRAAGAPVVSVLFLLVAFLAACGGGDDGPSEAFCNDLENLSEQIADGDPIDDQIDTVEDDLADSTAEGEQLDAVGNVADAYEDEDNDQADLADEVQDELGAFAEDCEIDEDEFAVAPSTTEAPETTTTTEGDTTTTEGSDTTLPPDDAGPEVLARADIPADIAVEFADLAGACFAGDMDACDSLYQTTPVDTVDEEYGLTCGGRIAPEDTVGSECATIITGPIDVPAEIVDQGLAVACFEGDMNACDTLFNTSPADSLDEAYGALCGGRVTNTTAFCVDIFGDIAFL